MTEIARTSEARLDRRALVLGLLFGSTAAFAAARQPRTHLDFLGRGKLEDIVPKKVGQWQFVTSSGLVVPPQDQLSQSLYSQLLTRVYSGGATPPIMLLMAQSAGQTGILQVHRPEVCYPASGFQLSSVTTDNMIIGEQILPTNRLTATVEGEAEQILYWTRIGDELPTNWREQRLAIAAKNLRGIIPDAMLIRLSIRSNEKVAAYQALEGFVRAMIAAIPATQRRIFIA